MKDLEQATSCKFDSDVTEVNDVNNNTLINMLFSAELKTNVHVSYNLGCFAF